MEIIIVLISIFFSLLILFIADAILVRASFVLRYGSGRASVLSTCVFSYVVGSVVATSSKFDDRAILIAEASMDLAILFSA